MLKSLTNIENFSKTKLFHGNANNEAILEELHGSLPDALLADPYKIMYVNNITPHILSFVIPICEETVMMQSIFERYFDMVDVTEYKILIEKFPTLLSKIQKKDQTVDICKAAIQKNYNTVKFNKIDDIELYKIAVKSNIKSLTLIKNHSMELYEYAIKLDPSSIKHFKKSIIDKFENKKKILDINWHCLEHLEKTPATCNYIVKKVSQSIQYVTESTLDLFMIALNDDGLCIKYIDNIKDDYDKNQLYETAVKQNGLAIQYISNKTIPLCLLAVKNNGDALQYIKKQNHNMCKEAIKQNPDSIRYATYKDREDIIRALDYNSKNFEFIEQTEDNIIYALNKNGLLLNMVKNQSYNHCLTAINQNPHSLQYATSITEDLIELALRKDGTTIKYIKNATNKHKEIALGSNPLAKMYFI